jgi:hypothetical protein
MQVIDILLKCVTLLHRENEIKDELSENSVALVKTILESTNIGNNKLFGGDSEILENLKHLVKEMADDPSGYDKMNLLQSLELIVKDKPSLMKIIEKTIDVEISPPALKRTVISTRHTLNNYYKEQQIKSLISKASYMLTTDKLNGASIHEFGTELMTNLDGLLVTTKAKDPGIVEELDVGDEDGLGQLMTKIKSSGENQGKLKCGWGKVNDMFAGGFQRYHMLMINALQHKYKSGFTQSLFMQIAQHNTPVMIDETKKPLITYISFEDDVEIIGEFMYKYLYYNEHKTLPDLTVVTGAEVAKYIKEKLGVNGYHVKIIRVNPSEWTYRSLFNKILEYEADGYELHACFVDYLEKLPTTGCINTGPGGTDLRDLFNRCRNFFGSKKIFFATPHQLSTEAKQLIRNGVPDVNFVKEVAGKGYTSASKQLDQVVDLELYIHIARVNRKPFLTIQRGKFRDPAIIDDDLLYTMLPFPKNAPILDDINNVDQDIDAIHNIDSSRDDGFDF